MEVRLADCAGFCFGVKRAVDTVYEQLKNGKTIYTYGPIVHNEEVVRELSEKGVRVLDAQDRRAGGGGQLPRGRHRGKSVKFLSFRAKYHFTTRE